MNSRSCGLVQRIGTVGSPTPRPDPSGGQAPALHFLIPPSSIGLQLGTFRPWRAGIEVEWRAHPGSESGTCFRANRSCRLPPADQGMKIGLGRRRCLAVVGATLPLWIPASARMTNWGAILREPPIPDRSPGHAFVPIAHAGCRRHKPRYENGTWSLEVFGCGWCHPSPLDSRFRPRMTNWGAGGSSEQVSRLRSIIFVPMTMWSSPTLVRRRPASAWAYIHQPQAKLQYQHEFVGSR